MSPVADTQAVSGALNTRMLYKAMPILTESIACDLQPGRWAVDASTPLPQDAKPGLCAPQSEQKSDAENFA